MKDLLILMMSSAAMTHPFQIMLNQIRNQGFSSLFLAPFISVTLLIWSQVFLLLCIADKTLNVISEKQDTQLLAMFFLMYLMVFGKIQVDNRKINQTKKITGV